MLCCVDQAAGGVTLPEHRVTAFELAQSNPSRTLDFQQGEKPESWLRPYANFRLVRAVRRLLSRDDLDALFLACCWGSAARAQSARCRRRRQRALLPVYAGRARASAVARARSYERRRRGPAAERFSGAGVPADFEDAP